jgi:hypothetical protein
MPLAVFQKIDCSQKIVFDQLTRARPIVKACQDARIRRGIDRPIGWRQTLYITRVTYISMVNFDPVISEAAIRFAAQPHQVVDTEQFRVWSSLTDPAGERRSDKPANPSDENLHGKTTKLTPKAMASSAIWVLSEAGGLGVSACRRVGVSKDWSFLLQLTLAPAMALTRKTELDESLTSHNERSGE